MSSSELLSPFVNSSCSVGSDTFLDLSLASILDELPECSLSMRLQHPVHNRNVLARNLVYCDIPNLIWYIRGVGQEQKVSTIESRLH
jgi:hypothetical protein